MKIASWRGLQATVSQEEANEVFASAAAPFEKETSRAIRSLKRKQFSLGDCRLDMANSACRENT